MKQEAKKSLSRRIAGLVLLKIIPAVLLVYLLVFTGVYVFSVKHKLKQLHQTYAPGGDSLSYSAEEWNLIRQKSLLNARVKMSDSDSIGMTINFGDSLVQLEMKGVVLRQTKFDEAEISRFFRSIHPAAYEKFFSNPFSITEIEGSIVKEPITVKKAPKDSLEAAQNITVTDTSRVKEFIEWHFQLDSTFIVSFVQSDRQFGKTDWSTIQYRLRRHSKKLKEINQALLSFRMPAYYPEITVFIPKNEAKSFFRALPQSGLVSLKF